MERIKERMAALRLETDEAMAKAEEYHAKVKLLEQENLTKEQEITSLQHKNSLLESHIEKQEESIKNFKKVADDSQQHGTHNETLQRRIQLLEDEAEEADKNLRECNEKLRQTDVKAGHYERKVQALEAEREQQDKKYEELDVKYKQLQKDVEELQTEIGNM
ncbi:Tropomyosin-2 [Escovopsis weberi]|uniref:Tropomyosin-2 n=1 Tax=Escovopsis weberi TaxID=150374 RepID=A0A0M9VSW1_ESCWE|nr:Tropomyosin-2 [Escovopsis weberi]